MKANSQRHAENRRGTKRFRAFMSTLYCKENGYRQCDVLINATNRQWKKAVQRAELSLRQRAHINAGRIQKALHKALMLEGRWDDIPF